MEEKIKNFKFTNSFNFFLNNYSKIFLIGVPFLITLISFLCFTKTGRDDAYITYGISENIIKGSLNGYNNYLYEQTSSIFFAAIISIISFFLEFLNLGFNYSFFFSVFSIYLISFNSLIKKRGKVFALLSLMGLAMIPNFSYWNWSGLENPLSTLLSFLLLIMINNFFKFQKSTY